MSELYAAIGLASIYGGESKSTNPRKLPTLIHILIITGFYTSNLRFSKAHLEKLSRSV